MKILFIVSSSAIVYLMKYKKPTKVTYIPEVDSFPLVYVIAPCAVLAILFPPTRTPSQILWAFSIYLEAVAILPQLIVVRTYYKVQDGSQAFVKNLTANYVFLLGAYRAMYLCNWIYRFAHEEHYRDWIAWIAGVVQTIIYMDFFYYYIKSKILGRTMSLPI